MVPSSGQFRQEAIRLYRDIVRASKLFTWRNEQGSLWSEILRKNARKEFEDAHFEKDPQIISRLIFVGRDCYNQTMEKLAITAKKMEENIDKTRTL